MPVSGDRGCLFDIRGFRQASDDTYSLCEVVQIHVLGRTSSLLGNLITNSTLSIELTSVAVSSPLLSNPLDTVL